MFLNFSNMTDFYFQLWPMVDLVKILKCMVGPLK